MGTISYIGSTRRRAKQPPAGPALRAPDRIRQLAGSRRGIGKGRRGLGDQPRQVMSSMLIIPYRRKFLKLSFAHLRLLDRFLEASFDGR